MSGLTTGEIERFGQDGYLANLPLLCDEEVASYRERLNHLIRACDPKLHNHILQMHTVLPWAHALATHPIILNRIASLLGPDILLWKSKCFLKPPSLDAVVPWHQDMAHWDLEPPRSVTAWVALTPTYDGNGAMQVLPGSHRAGELTHVTDKRDAGLLTSGLCIRPPDKHKVCCIELRPGEMSLHDGYLVHGSPGNASDAMRVGTAFVYIPAVATQRGVAHCGVMLVRGRDRAGFFPLAPPPLPDEAATRRAIAAFSRYNDGSEIY